MCYMYYMKINFIGSSGSGKTTVAAMVFARLKELGFCCEFVTEQARLYISGLRYKNKDPNFPVILEDQDQLEIMTKQFRVENIVSYSLNGSGDIICDSSPLNALFYMTEGFRDDSKVKLLVEETLKQSDATFYCEPVTAALLLDPNRVHTSEQSLQIDRNISSVLKKCTPGLIASIKCLKGSPEDRASKVVNYILNKKC